MARGRPDYAQTAPIEGVWGVSDLGEVAARLGSASTWERRGHVVWQDWFEHGLQPWAYIGNGTGSGVVCKLGTTYRGNLAAELTGGSDGLANAYIHVTLPLVTYERMGLEVALAPRDNWEWFEIHSNIYTGARLYTGRLRYYRTDNSLCIYTTGGVKIVLASGLKPLFQGDVWHIMKLVVDFTTLKYVRAIFENTEYNLAGYDMYDLGATSNLYCSFYVWVSSNVGVNGVLKVGQVIITRNEP